MSISSIQATGKGAVELYKTSPEILPAEIDLGKVQETVGRGSFGAVLLFEYIQNIIYYIYYYGSHFGIVWFAWEELRLL